MNTERTISICGQEVSILYCAATETGYESISGQSSEIFIPSIERDSAGKVIATTSRATTRDYIQLAVAAIIAAYASRHQDSPITVDDILYKASSKEVTTLITTVIELRAAWYSMPNIVSPGEATDSKEGGQKN